MSLESQILQAIGRGKTSAADFERSWRVCREGVIMPIFERAANVFATAFADTEGTGRAELKNGTTVTLYALRDKEKGEFSLTFRADMERKEVVCSYNPPFEPVEHFDLNRLTAKEIERRVIGFSQAVAEGRERAALD